MLFVLKTKSLIRTYNKNKNLQTLLLQFGHFCCFGHGYLNIVAVQMDIPNIATCIN